MPRPPSKISLTCRFFVSPLPDLSHFMKPPTLCIQLSGRSALVRSTVLVVVALLLCAFWSAPAVGVPIQSRLVEAERLAVAVRLTISRSFTELYGRQGAGVDEFTAWAADSGRLAMDSAGDGGSTWWRGVNGMIVMDISEAQNAINAASSMGGTPTALPRNVQCWVDYALHSLRSHKLNPIDHLESQRLWWTAHQVSLHNGIHGFAYSLANEPARELRFISDIVVRNVDMVALVNGPTDIKAIKAYTALVYPSMYPPTAVALAKATLLAPSTLARLFGITDEVGNIGLNSTRWDAQADNFYAEDSISN